jgi:hypothetical protein
MHAEELMRIAIAGVAQTLQFDSSQSHSGANVTEQTKVTNGKWPRVTSAATLPLPLNLNPNPNLNPSLNLTIISLSMNLVAADVRRLIILLRTDQSLPSAATESIW